jgi:hypothetical protein
VVVEERRTNGTVTHTGRLIVSRRLDTGELASVTLPDDVGAAGPSQAEFDALVARVVALEARPVIDSLEDLKYGN